MSGSESNPTSVESVDAAQPQAPKLGWLWWSLLVLSLGMLGWGLRPFPLDTNDSTLERALSRGQLERASLILKARKDAQSPEAANTEDVEKVASELGITDPSSLPLSSDVWAWTEVAFVGGSLDEVPPISELRSAQPFSATVQRMYECLYATHDLARLRLVLDWIADENVAFPPPNPDKFEREFVHHPGEVDVHRFPLSRGMSAVVRRDLFRTPLRPDDLPEALATKDSPKDEWREWLLAACLRTPKAWSTMAQALLDVGHNDPDLVLLAAGHFPEMGLEQDRRRFLEHLGFLMQPDRAPGAPQGRGQYVALLNAFADGMIRAQQAPDQELLMLQRFDDLLFPETKALLVRIWPPGSDAAEFAERSLIARRYLRLAEMVGKQSTALDPYFPLGRGREAHAVGGETADALLDRVETLLTPCFQSPASDVKVLTQARMLLATARDLHGDLEGAYTLWSAMADQGDAAHGTEVFFPLAMNAMALAALETEEASFTAYLVTAENALDRCDPDARLQDSPEGSGGQSAQSGIKVARTLLGLLQSQAQPERHLAKASFDATPEAVVARSILTAHCALIGGRNASIPDGPEEGVILEHHADALRPLLTASSEFLAPTQSDDLEPYRFEVWRLRIRIAAAQTPPDWETVHQLLGELEKVYIFRDQGERKTYLSWRYRANKELGREAAAARTKEQLEHLEQEMREQTEKVGS
ncbi:MAG: hypothetical protein CMJ28_02785 [Phycisphaerae bacterium]|nr:hypothetical protein [Phycisphaerae bacterium]